MFPSPSKRSRQVTHDRVKSVHLCIDASGKPPYDSIKAFCRYLEVFSHFHYQFLIAIFSLQETLGGTEMQLICICICMQKMPSQWKFQQWCNIFFRCFDLVLSDSRVKEKKIQSVLLAVKTQLGISETQPSESTGRQPILNLYCIISSLADQVLLIDLG